MNNICYGCKKPRVLTFEHIIPQSLGGKLKHKLYCKECNDILGRVVDAELAKQYGHIATYLVVTRERGETRSIELEETESKDSILFDGQNLKRKSPIVKIETEDDGKTLKHADVRAGTQKELLQIIESIKKKYITNQDFDILEDPPKPHTDLTQHSIIDNHLLRRAVTKIAYSFLCTRIDSQSILSEHFDKTRLYIIGTNTIDLACSNYIHTQFMTDYARPLHKIHISHDRSNKLTIGYVMLFGMYRFTILLSESFISSIEWPDFDYTFDPVRQQQIFGNYNFRAPPITKLDVLKPKQTKEIVQEELSKGSQIIESYMSDFRFIDGELT